MHSACKAEAWLLATQLSDRQPQGSGKTLAFGLPIIQLLLEEQSRADDSSGAAPEDAGGGDPPGMADAGTGQAEGVPVGARKRMGGPLRALIVAPTRELAMQARLLSALWLTQHKPL